MGGSGPAICSSDGHLRPSAPGRVFSPRLSGVTTEIRQEEELLEQKKVRAIGISNFGERDLQDLLRLWCWLCASHRRAARRFEGSR